MTASVWESAYLLMVTTMSAQTIDDALIAILRQSKEGVEAEELRQRLEDMGYSRTEVRAALSGALNKGRAQLGPNLRFALELA